MQMTELQRRAYARPLARADQRPEFRHLTHGPYHAEVGLSLNY